MISSVLILVLISLSINLVSSLECYVCENQEDNFGKCRKTIKTCSYDEDVCLTEIKWGSTPYWQQGALKQYYVSKRCSTADKCYKYKKALMPFCTNIWYQDWQCADCCKGDKCNFYVFSGSNTFHISTFIFTCTIMLNLFLSR